MARILQPHHWKHTICSCDDNANMLCWGRTQYHSSQRGQWYKTQETTRSESLLGRLDVSPYQGQLQMATSISSSWLRARLNYVHGALYDGPFNVLGALECLLKLHANPGEAGAQLHMSRSM